jgi:mRNA-degrading endonuclease RelE of RelBE toxin-antitoxin system
MSVLEKEIIERVEKLDEENQRQVLAFIRSLDKPDFSLERWVKRVQALRAEQQAGREAGYRVDVQSLLDEVREEPLDDRLGRG